MDQAVQVYDDATARDTALPSPLEGQLVYLKDQDTVQKYNGAAFVPVGGLVETKSVLKTDTFTSSVTAGNNVAVTGLSLTHEVQTAGNKIIISAFFGAAASSDQTARVGIAINDGTGFIGVGDTRGSRTSIGAGGRTAGTAAGAVVNNPSVSFIYAPGSGSKTYTVHVVNIDTATRTLYVNRTETDADNSSHLSAVSGLTIQEVAV
jgi:hypothetical protein